MGSGKSENCRWKIVNSACHTNTQKKNTWLPSKFNVVLHFYFIVQTVSTAWAIRAAHSHTGIYKGKSVKTDPFWITWRTLPKHLWPALCKASTCVSSSFLTPQPLNILISLSSHSLYNPRSVHNPRCTLAAGGQCLNLPEIALFQHADEFIIHCDKLNNNPLHFTAPFLAFSTCQHILCCS